MDLKARTLCASPIECIEFFHSNGWIDLMAITHIAYYFPIPTLLKWCLSKGAEIQTDKRAELNLIQRSVCLPYSDGDKQIDLDTLRDLLRVYQRADRSFFPAICQKLTISWLLQFTVSQLRDLQKEFGIPLREYYWPLPSRTCRSDSVQRIKYLLDEVGVKFDPISRSDVGRRDVLALLEERKLLLQRTQLRGYTQTFHDNALT